MPTLALIRDEAFLRQQIGYCTDYYRQVRPGSRAAAEVAADQHRFRSELAALLRARRAAAPAQQALF